MSFRKTWDKEYYEQKAKERIEFGEEPDKDKQVKKLVSSSETKEEFLPASVGAIGPSGSARAFLKAREHKVDLESKAGKTELFTPTETKGGRNSGPGYHCQVCDCTLKDSASYLDHINGKKHLRALGFSQRVERSEVSQVQERLNSIKRKMEEAKGPRTSAVDDYESKVAQQLIDDDLRKKQRKAAIQSRKQQQEIAEEATIDPEIASMLGFDGFGSSKKK